MLITKVQRIYSGKNGFPEVSEQDIKQTHDAIEQAVETLTLIGDDFSYSSYRHTIVQLMEELKALKEHARLLKEERE